MLRLLLEWLPPIAWATLIWNVSALPNPPGLLPFPGFDKLAHAVVYGVLALLCVRALRRRAGLRTAAIVAVSLAAAYGIVDELHQSFVPERNSSTADAAADLLGAVIAAGLWLKRTERTA